MARHRTTAARPVTCLEVVIDLHNKDHRSRTRREKHGAQRGVKGEPIRNKFLIHSGFGGAILFDDATANQFGFTKHLAIIAESELQDSYGNVLKTKKAILPQFSIANQQLTNVPIGFFEGSIGRQKMSVIGGEILKRFNIIFDTQHSSIFLRANELTQSPFSDSLGVSFNYFCSQPVTRLAIQK